MKIEVEDYSDAQRWALQKSYDLLSEHFSEVVICVECEVDDNQNNFRIPYMVYHGGKSAAVGLAYRFLKWATGSDDYE